jgi:SNF2 family DNA or RNA helicase
VKIATVDFVDSNFLVECPFYDNERAKGIPDRKWDRTEKKWRASMSSANIRYIKKEYGPEELTPAASAQISESEAKSTAVSESRFPAWFNFRNDPMKHQIEALNLAWGKDEYALFHEMGCGKTFSAICLYSARIMDKAIDAYLVLCPTPVKHVWPTEIEKHSPLQCEDVYTLKAGDRGFDRWIVEDNNGPKVLVVGIEALSQGTAFKKAQRFLMAYRCGVILDESTKIKNHDKARTERAVDLGGLALFRLILNGSPITQGMQDLYSQFLFLNWDIIGHKSYYTFRNRYCVMGGFDSKAIVGYQNVPELLGLVQPHCHSVSKAEALDLPPKVYASRVVEPTKAQLEAIKELKSQMIAFVGEEHLEIQTALDGLTRYQQICGGMFPYNDGVETRTRKDGTKVMKKLYSTKPIPGKNPKLDEMVDILTDLPDDVSVIIWARFRPEIAVIVDAIESKWPGSTIEYHGGIDDDDRKKAVDQFQAKEKRFFVSNQATGGVGLTLTAATVVIYFSNSYSYYDRAQSEDRAHRKGQTNKVTYIDITLNLKPEKAIVEALRNKEDIANMVNTELRKGSIGAFLE